MDPTTTSWRPLLLRAEAGPDGRDISIPGGEKALLGRGEECTAPLLHEGVSRRHAEISFDRGQWRVTDLGSRHGTRVDGRVIPPNTAALLTDGATLSIGPWTWRVEFDPTSRGDEVVALQRPAGQKRGAETYATRPTIFLRLKETDPQRREVSWQEFTERYAPVIVGFARNAGLRAGDCEDILQDVLLGFFQAAPRFQYDPARGRFRGYLKTCVLNAMKRRKPGTSASIEDFDPAEESATEAVWERAWAEQTLERAAREVALRVDAKTFEAFDLYGRRGVPAEAVAEKLGMAVNSVHQAKARVVKLIREVVDEIRESEG